MKTTIITLFTSLLLLSLNIEEALSYTYFSDLKTDSINKRDENGLKQGYWIVFYKSGNKIAKKGTFINNKKEGVWTSYFENKNIKDEISYINGKPMGLASFYYKNGLLRESGNWHNNHWQGSYKYYYESGQLSYHWNYNEYGKREGAQKYFHANGKKMYEGNWRNGKTEGALKVFNENGELIQENIFNNGVFAETKKTDPKKVSSIIIPEVESPIRNKFLKTGFHTTFNLSGNMVKKGFFVKGNLFNGEEFIYNDEDILVKVLIFKNGKLEDTIEKNK